MKILDNINGLVFCVVFSFMTGLFVSCDSIEDPEVYDVANKLPSVGNLRVTDVTTSTITVEWDAVPGAVQYGAIVYDANGKVLAGGTTNETIGIANGLDLFTEYEIKVTAIPEVGKGAVSDVATISAKTAFYDCVDNEEGTYTSYLSNADGENWTATLDEDRSAADYKEGTLGVFTLKNFYNRSAGKLVFAVNKDNTITILNATGYDDNGWAGVTTGFPQAARKTIYIDESSSVFDRANTMLTYTAKFANSAAPQIDMFNW